MPDLFRDTTVLITGASRGIGAAFARLLAPRGARLLLVARHVADLERVAASVRQLGGSAEVFPADLAPAEAPARLATAVAARGFTVDHLINNAGIGPQGRFQDLPVTAQLPVIDVNVRAVTALAGLFLPGMVARRRGGILNVASTAAWQGLTWLPVYSGSKAYVITWSEATWGGLRGTGVRCCCVSPGPVDTPFLRLHRLWSAAALADAVGGGGRGPRAPRLRPRRLPRAPLPPLPAGGVEHPPGAPRPGRSARRPLRQAARLTTLTPLGP
ncbi:MAG: SDR family NAD(P)-dependent oxidoreductase [Gemmatimonadetes bacterium]|nr:SDR family NAD(P)-dependent oxidoreductase [Gemmatimonadota bacterium]